MSYTLAQAAAALGESERTLRRRVEKGDLSATKEQRGGRSVTLVDGAELARYAAAHGRKLTLPALTGTDRQKPAGTDRQLTGTDRQTATPGGAVVADLAAELTRLRTEREWQEGATADLRDRIRELQEERDWLREKVDELTAKALPAHTGTDRQATDRHSPALTGTHRQTERPAPKAGGLLARLSQAWRELAGEV